VGEKILYSKSVSWQILDLIYIHSSFQIYLKFKGIKTPKTKAVLKRLSMPILQRKKKGSTKNHSNMVAKCIIIVKK